MSIKDILNRNKNAGNKGNKPTPVKDFIHQQANNPIKDASPVIKDFIKNRQHNEVKHTPLKDAISSVKDNEVKHTPWGTPLKDAMTSIKDNEHTPLKDIADNISKNVHMPHLPRNNDLTIKDTAHNIADTVKTNISDTFNSIKSRFNAKDHAHLDAIKDNITEVVNNVKHIPNIDAASFIDKVKTGIDNKIDDIKLGFPVSDHHILDNIKTQVTSTVNNIKNNGLGNIRNNISNTIETVKDDIHDFFDDKNINLDTIKDTADNIKSNIGEHLSDFMQGDHPVIDNIESEVMNIINNIKNSIGGISGSGIVINTLLSSLNGVKQLIMHSPTEITSAITMVSNLIHKLNNFNVLGGGKASLIIDFIDMFLNNITKLLSLGGSAVNIIDDIISVLEEILPNKSEPPSVPAVPEQPSMSDVVIHQQDEVNTSDMASIDDDQLVSHESTVSISDNTNKDDLCSNIDQLSDHGFVIEHVDTFNVYIHDKDHSDN